MSLSTQMLEKPRTTQQVVGATFSIFSWLLRMWHSISRLVDLHAEKKR